MCLPKQSYNDKKKQNLLEISYIPMILDVMYDKSKSFLTYLGEEAFRIDFL